MAIIYTVLLFLLLSQQGLGQKGKCAQKFVRDDRQCDAYLECNEETGEIEQKMCPDGLVFKDGAGYPCAYPVEVDCQGRSRQPAKRTADCPNQYALFNKNCKEFTSCVEGVATTMQCPAGLAFNDNTVTCDWPDNVQGCENVNDFRCPNSRSTDHEHERYSHESDCRQFYVCIQGSARLHSCSLGQVFNDETMICEDPQNVPKCANYYPRDILDAINVLRSQQLLK